MTKWICILLGLNACTSFAACNHHIVDRSKKLACVNVSNASRKTTVSVTSLDGGLFKLQPNTTEEAALTPGHKGTVKIVPHPPVPHFNKTLTCTFSIAEAKRNRITVVYQNNESFSVFPANFTEGCQLKDI